MPLKKGSTRYGALAALIKKRIYAGEWVPGVALPAEMELARYYEVALGTIRQAIEVLAAEKLLIKQHGRGTFVNSGLTGNTTLRFFRFSRNITQQNQPVSLVQRWKVLPPTNDQQILFGPECQHVLTLERLRSLDQAPRVHEKIWLPLPLFSAMVELKPAKWENRLYPLYAKYAGVTIVNASDSLFIEPMPMAVSRQLGFPKQHPGLVIKRKSLDILGRIVEYRVAVGDAYEFTYSDEAG